MPSVCVDERINLVLIGGRRDLVRMLAHFKVCFLSITEAYVYRVCYWCAVWFWLWEARTSYRNCIDRPVLDGLLGEARASAK